jgi:hemoglobin-like flavoprotein
VKPTQITLVQESFAKVAPIADQAAVMFYNRLFEIAPQVKAMFPADMTEQRKKLMAMLAAVVKGLGNLETVLPAASALAKRHVTYGAKAEHYPVVGAALPDFGEGTWRRLDARSCGGVDRRIRLAVRLHDF